MKAWLVFICALAVACILSILVVAWEVVRADKPLDGYSCKMIPESNVEVCTKLKEELDSNE